MHVGFLCGHHDDVLCTINPFYLSKQIRCVRFLYRRAKHYATSWAPCVLYFVSWFWGGGLNCGVHRLPSVGWTGLITIKAHPGFQCISLAQRCCVLSRVVVAPSVVCWAALSFFSLDFSLPGLPVAKGSGAVSAGPCAVLGLPSCSGCTAMRAAGMEPGASLGSEAIWQRASLVVLSSQCFVLIFCLCPAQTSKLHPF